MKNHLIALAIDIAAFFLGIFLFDSFTVAAYLVIASILVFIYILVWLILKLFKVKNPYRIFHVMYVIYGICALLLTGLAMLDLLSNNHFLKGLLAFLVLIFPTPVLLAAVIIMVVCHVKKRKKLNAKEPE